MWKTKCASLLDRSNHFDVYLNEHKHLIRVIVIGMGQLWCVGASKTSDRAGSIVLGDSPFNIQ